MAKNQSASPLGLALGFVIACNTRFSNDNEMTVRKHNIMADGVQNEDR